MLALVYSKRHLQHNGMPFIPQAPSFTTFLLGHAQKSKFGLESDLLLKTFRFL